MNKNFNILVIVMSLVAFTYSIFVVIFPLYLDYKNISLPTIGLIFSLPVIAGLITRIIVGTAADVYGRKRFYAIGLITGSISNFLFGFANTAWHFFSINIFAKSSSALKNATDHLLIYESVKKNSAGRAFGKLRSATKLLAFIGTFAAGSILLYLGYTGVFLLCSFVYIISFLIFLNFKERKIRPEKFKLLNIFDFKGMTRNLKVFTLSGIFFDAASGLSAAFAIQLFLTKIFGLSVIHLSIVLGLTVLAYSISAFFFGKLSDMFSPKKVFVIMYLLLAVDAVLIGLIPSVLFVSLLWIISGVFMGIGDATRRKMVNMYARSRHRGRDTNISRTISGFGALLGPLIAAYVAVISFGYVFILTGVACLLSALTMLLIRE